MPQQDRAMQARLIAVFLSLVLTAAAGAASTLSGSYTGSITYTPKNGVTSYQDRGATLNVLPDTGKGVLAVVTYSDQMGRYRENCSITSNPDGTITLKGVSYTILSGSSFY